jgi:hypothetical protein
MSVGALVAAVLRKLIGQIAIGGMQLDAIETGSLRPLRRFAIVLDERYRGSLGDDEAAVGRSLSVILEHQIAGDIPWLLGS